MLVEVGGLEVLGGLGVQAGWIENEDEDRVNEDERVEVCGRVWDIATCLCRDGRQAKKIKAVKTGGFLNMDIQDQ